VYGLQFAVGVLAESRLDDLKPLLFFSLNGFNAAVTQFRNDQGDKEFGALMGDFCEDFLDRITSRLDIDGSRLEDA